MRNLMYIFILFVTLLIQSTLLVYYQPLNVIPDLLLVIVISGALIRGSKFGVILGLMAGFLQDILIGDFGTFMLIKIFVGYIIGNLEGKVFKQQILIPIFCTFLFTFVHEFLFLLLSEQLIFSISPLSALKDVVFPLAVVNSVFTLLLYPILYKLENKYYYLYN